MRRLSITSNARTDSFYIHTTYTAIALRYQRSGPRKPTSSTKALRSLSSQSCGLRTPRNESTKRTRNQIPSFANKNRGWEGRDVGYFGFCIVFVCTKQGWSSRHLLLLAFWCHNIPCSFLWLHPSLTIWSNPPYCWAHCSFATTLRPAFVFHTSRVNILVSFGFSWINVEAGQDGWKYVTVTGAVIDPILRHAMQLTRFDQASILEEIGVYIYIIYIYISVCECVSVCVCVCACVNDCKIQAAEYYIIYFLHGGDLFYFQPPALRHWPGLVLLMEGLLQACGNECVGV